MKTGSIPADLDAYRAPAAAINQVRQHFESLGFKALDDPLKLVLYLNAPASLFASCFGVLQPAGGDVLQAPDELKQWIEEIVVMRSPEWI